MINIFSKNNNSENRECITEQDRRASKRCKLEPRWSKELAEKVAILSDLNVQVRNGLSFFQGIKEAEAGIQDEDPLIQGFSLVLLRGLVEQGKGEAQAIAVKSGIYSQDQSVRLETVLLFCELAKKGQGLDEGIEVAQVGAKDRNSLVKAKSLDLFRMLMAKGKGSSQAAMAVFKGLEDSNLLIKWAAIDLVKDLLDKFPTVLELYREVISWIGKEDRYVAVTFLRRFELKQLKQWIRQLVASQPTPEEWVGVESISAFLRKEGKSDGLNGIVEKNTLLGLKPGTAT